MVNTLLRKFRLIRLKVRGYILEAQVEDAAELLENHQIRLRLALSELGQIRRRIIAAEEPEVLLRKAA